MTSEVDQIKGQGQLFWMSNTLFIFHPKIFNLLNRAKKVDKLSDSAFCQPLHVHHFLDKVQATRRRHVQISHCWTQQMYLEQEQTLFKDLRHCHV